MTAGAAAQSSDDDTALPPVPKPRFTVVDGDTVKFGPQVVRLFGIDAPERSQTCDDGQWRAGTLARKALEEFIAGRPVTCRLVDPDRKTRPPVAQCFAGEDDLQEKMVPAGPGRSPSTARTPTASTNATPRFARSECTPTNACRPPSGAPWSGARR